jgi:hypothetical protein
LSSKKSAVFAEYFRHYEASKYLKKSFLGRGKVYLFLHWLVKKKEVLIFPDGSENNFNLFSQTVLSPAEPWFIAYVEVATASSSTFLCGTVDSTSNWISRGPGFKPRSENIMIF